MDETDQPGISAAVTDSSSSASKQNQGVIQEGDTTSKWSEILEKRDQT
jgi:hypothetical protein